MNFPYTKDQIRMLTQEITPEQSQYVAQVSNIFNNVAPATGSTGDQQKDDVRDICILFVNKLKAFAVKFDDASAAQGSNCGTEIGSQLRSITYIINDMCDQILRFIRNIFNIDANESVYTNLTLPIDPDPLVLINELKDCMYEMINYINSREEQFDDISVIKAIIKRQVIDICEYCFRLRLSKVNAETTAAVLQNNNLTRSF